MQLYLLKIMAFKAYSVVGRSILFVSIMAKFVSTILADTSVKNRYVGEANRLKGVPKDRAVGGSVEGFLYDQDGHRTLAPLAAAHDRAGLV